MKTTSHPDLLTPQPQPWKLLKFFLVCTIGGWILTGCNPIYYAPNSHNVPLLSGGGEAKITAAGNADRVEFQGAYAISDHFGLQASGGLFIPREEENGNGGSGHFLEAGGGYLHRISPNWIFEGYGLIGTGKVENHFEDDSPGPTDPSIGDLSASIFRWGVQPNLGYRSPYFSAALSTRLSNLIFHNVEGDLVFNNIDQVSYLTDHNSYFLVEPALTIRGGFQKAKLQLQLGLSYNITDPEFDQETGYITVGFHFTL